MPYKGELKKLVQYTINVDCSAVTGKTAITVLKINRQDKLAAGDTYSVAAGQRTQFTDTIGDRIDRVIYEVHPPKGQSALIEVAGIPETCNGDLDLVFDTIA